MDPVNRKALKGKFKDRADKDIDNDGDVDSSDEYLHKRRKAISKAIGKIKEELELDEAAPKMKGDFIKTQREKDKAHADAMGRHVKSGRKKTMTSTQRSLASMRKEEVELDEAEMSLYDKIKAARANPSPDKPVRGRGSKNRNPKAYDVRNTLDKEDDRLQAKVKKKLKKEEVELEEEIKHYIVGSSGQNLTGHTSQPHFKSSEDAKAYQKKFKHVPHIRSAKIVKGTSDKHGFITPVSEEVELDEVLDTPKAMDSYKAKAKYSKERAANSAAAKMLRNKNGFHSTDTSQELKTMDKRTKGLKMADKNAMKKTFKKLRGEEVELDEVSTEKLRDYASAALQDKNKAKAYKRWKYASKAMNTVGDREAKAAHALKYNKKD